MSTKSTKATTITKTTKLATAARILLGAVFTLSGLNHLLWFVPMPAMTGAAALFWQGLLQTGWFFPLLAVVEIAAGQLLVWRRLVPLALALVAPIAVNVALFHAALAPEGLPVAALVVGATAWLAWRERAAFASVLRARAEARSAGVRAVELLLGVAFVASGVAGALGRTPPPATAGAALMMKGLAASGYFLPFLCAVQMAAGALLVARRWVGVALMALAPVAVEIVAYRLWVAGATPRMMGVAAAILAAVAWLAHAHRLHAAVASSSGSSAVSCSSVSRMPRSMPEAMAPSRTSFEG